MGLDMYLSKKVYVKSWDYTPEDKRYEVVVKRCGKVLSTKQIDPARVSYIIEDIGYWRKANAIHRWFVESCQNGVDDCRPTHVGRRQLELLLDLVEKVLAASSLSESEIEVEIGCGFKDGKPEPIMGKKRLIADPSVARELLPTCEGFFFGSTDYDDWYYGNLVNTRKILTTALSDPEADEFEYDSSW